MDYTTVLAQLERLIERNPNELLARITARWIESEARHSAEAGNAAANDPLIANLVSSARLATDCGWTPEFGQISSNTALLEPFYPDIAVYCDGSCTNNGKAEARAGYGIYVLRDGREIHSHSARVPSGDPQTNQRAELYAIQYALNYVGESGVKANIFTDSKYAIDCLQTWAPAWEAAGWRKSDKKPILHLDLIQPTIELFRSLGPTVQLKHIVGHAGLRGNEEADRLARIGAALDS
jgi:ribonuclease HI